MHEVHWTESFTPSLFVTVTISDISSTEISFSVDAASEIKFVDDRQDNEAVSETTGAGRIYEEKGGAGGFGLGMSKSK